MDFQLIINLFEQLFRGEHLSDDDILLIALCILAFVLFIVTIVLLVMTAYAYRFWMYVGWFFEDVWEWMKYVYRRIF